MADNDDFASMLAQFERETDAPAKNPHKKLKSVREGQTVRARVVSVGHEAVFVDLGGKSEGMIDLVELRDAEGHPTVKVGDEVEARVIDASGKSGCIVLRVAGMGRGVAAKAELEQAAAVGLPVEGTISAVNKGGVEVMVAGLRAFCPMSQIDLRHVADAAAWVGQKHLFKITRYDASGRSIDLVVSRRALLEEEQARKAEAIRDQLVPGSVLKGTVTSLKDYGAFVDLGGVEGMIHVSELGFSRVSKPADVLSPGQPVEVVILKISEPEKGEKFGRIALSLKALAADPWFDAVEQFAPGTRLTGTVVRVETFGAFVELTPGVEGLLHISELDRKGPGAGPRHAKELVKAGDKVDVVVGSVDKERRRISLEAGSKAEDRQLESEARSQMAVTGTAKPLGTFADLLKKSQAKKKQ
jgi:small subunit ribosomal protein S1